LVIGSIAESRLTTVYSIANTITKRLGELRNFNISSELPGSWLRTYTDHGGFKDLNSVRTHNYGIEGGIDKTIIEGCTGRMIAGIGIGINYGKQDVKTNNSRDGGGDSKTPYIGVYNTMTWDSGLYIDTIARYAYMDQDARYYDGSNMRQKFETTSHVLMLSAEAGYNYQLTDKFAIEPSIEFLYSFLKGDSFRDDASYEAKYDDTESVLGRTGFLLRYNAEVVEPYVKINYYHEFDGKTGITYDGTKYNGDLSGSRYEVGLGFVAKTDTDLNLFGETSYTAGSKSYRDYNVNLGMRYNF
jgi:outer membrane autotransporter protein